MLMIQNKVLESETDTFMIAHTTLILPFGAYVLCMYVCIILTNDIFCKLHDLLIAQCG